MNKSHKKEIILHNEYHYPENIIGQYDIMELPVFGDKKQNGQNQQLKKKILKPICTHTLSATRQQQCSSNSSPYQTIYTNRTGARSNTSNINNILHNDHIIRIKKLENELVEARMKNCELTTENHLLKKLEKRHENALSVYEGKKAKLPQVIKSYEEDIRTLQNKIQQIKNSYKELENRYKSQSNELLILQKQYKHLLSLSKNKELSKKKNIHDQLEEAHNTIKQQQSEIQNFMKQLELQNKTHRYHMNSENIKVKQLRLEVKRLKDENQNVGLKSKHFNARQGFAKGITENSINITPRVIKPVPTIRGQGDKIEESFNKTNGSISLKSESPYKEYENNYPIKTVENNITKDFNIRVDDKPFSINASSSIPRKNHGIMKLTKENKTELSNIISSEFEKQNEQKVNASHSRMSRIQKDLLLANLNKVREEKNGYESYYKTKSLNKNYQSSDSSGVRSESTTSD